MNGNDPLASAAPPDSDATAAGEEMGASPHDSGFILQGTAWDAVAGQSLAASDIRDFLIETDQDPALRAAATLMALTRLREVLSQVSEMEPIGFPVTIPLQDAVLMARQVLGRLR